MSTAQALFPAPPSSVSAETARHWIAAGEAVLIDVRDPEEYADEHIPGAVLLPLAGLDAAALPDTGSRRVILHCLTGKRSATALARLTEQGVSGLLHLEGGLLAWKKAGGITIEADEAVAA
jgi:rhodanese-related sulfurtransferase